MKKYFVPFLISLIFCLGACSSEDGQSTDDLEAEEEIKKITWEQIDLPDSKSVDNFAVSDDGRYLFYTASNNYIYRYDIVEKKETKLYGDGSTMGRSFVHVLDGKLYMITYHDNKSYFSVSNDNGNTITRNLVATFVPFAPQTAFVRADFNRLFRLTDGTLLFPHFTNTTTKVEEISISTDGGKTWAKKNSGIVFIHASQGNRLFATPGDWQGEYGIGASGGGLHFSDNKGDTWTKSDLKYSPQAVDREGNLIGAESDKFQKLKGNKWTIYTWDGNFPYASKLSNVSSGGTVTQRISDIEFDLSNNLYLLSGRSGGPGSAIFKTKLD